MLRVVSALLILPLLYGCIGNPIKDPANDTVSFVAAHVDMKAINGRCDGGRLKNLDNESGSEDLWYMYRKNHEHECFLYAKAVEPGRYAIQGIDTFYMTGASSSVATRYMLPDNGKPYGVHAINKQGIYFLGSFKFVRSSDGGLSLVKSGSLTEKQVFSEMLEHRLMKPGGWKNQIQQHVSKL